jgi:hypothetical protein
VSEILDTLPDHVDRQSWEAEYTRKTYETVRAAAAKTLLDTSPAPPICPWAPIQADRFWQKAGDLLACAADECGTEELGEIRSMPPESLRLAVSPVRRSSHGIGLLRIWVGSSRIRKPFILLVPRPPGVCLSGKPRTLRARRGLTRVWRPRSGCASAWEVRRVSALRSGGRGRL